MKSFSLYKRALNLFFLTSPQVVFYSFIVVLISVFILLSQHTSANSDGAPLACVGAAKTKDGVQLYPPAFATCNILGCHYQYTVGSGKGKFMLFVLDTCEPGEIVDILVSFKKTDTYYHGFQIAAQDRYFNRLVGTFINVGNDDDTQVEAGGLYATHTKKGTNRKYWHVKWQAPPEDFWIANPVRFFAVGLEADNDGTAMGDYVYSATRNIIVAPKKPRNTKIQLSRKE
ncbi:MAG: hypothetical protein E3K37_11785 [Candidatus Kuenenia sp.]|nr:hypothetical protein [Candidatus Kuenenia hertensis]